MKRLIIAAGFLAAAAPALAQGDLRIGLQDDPDTLDPATNWSFVGRHVLQSLCDKIVDVDQQGAIVPMLATAWEWSDGGKALVLKLRPNVTFHDGEKFDAEAVRYNIERALTMKTSRRRPEIDVIESAQVVDPLTIRLVLKQPSVPLLAALSDRAGMMVSPEAAEASGDNFTRSPVCAGPYRFVEHVAQDRIVLQKYAGHWRAADFAFDKLIYRGLPDSNVRLLNLRSGQLDLIERLAPSNVVEVEQNKALQTYGSSSLGYFGITFNFANGTGMNPTVAQSAAVRQAFDLAIDRNAINQVAFEGRYEAGNQAFPPTSPFYDTTKPVKPRDLEAAKAKLKEAGVANLTIDLLVPTDPERQQVAQLVQAMVGEVGIKLNVVSTELMSLLARARQGGFQAHLVGWSGRVDPDLNLTPIIGCGTAGNDGKYCNEKLDAILAEARRVPDVEIRKAKYREATAILLADLPISYLYHSRWTFAASAKLSGLKAYPDGIIRLEGVKRGG